MANKVRISCKETAKRQGKKTGTITGQAEEFKRRMLEWPNPVEFVNNLYGSHPGKDNTEYFRKVFGKGTQQCLGTISSTNGDSE